MPDMTETEIECPYCGEEITILVDTSVESQTYIEDCSVCCRPIQFNVSCSDGELQRAEASKS